MLSYLGAGDQVLMFLGGVGIKCEQLRGMCVGTYFGGSEISNNVGGQKIGPKFQCDDGWVVKKII